MSNWNGVPENPGRDGWHWCATDDRGEACPFEWRAKEDQWFTDDGWQDPEDFAEEWSVYHGPCAMPAEVAALRERAEKAEAEAKYLRDAIETAQVTCEIPPLPMHDFQSAYDAIHQVAHWHQMVALDPAVSEEARKLQADAREKALREAAKKWRIVAAIEEALDADGEPLSWAPGGLETRDSVKAAMAESTSAAIRALMGKEPGA